MEKYMPKQADIIWIDFDPSKGHEIKKRRPAVVLSKDKYNELTNFVVVSPITSTIRDLPTFYTLSSKKYKVHGQVNCQQLYSYDCTKNAHRNIEFVEKMQLEDFYQVAQLINSIFDFGI